MGSVSDALIPPESFTVRISSTGQEFVVPPEKSILEALEAARIYPDNSCRDGICGTCETAVISGIPDHRDDLLSFSEQASGKTMLICVSRSLSPVLEIDV